jgi:hypothetical protein
MKSNRITRKLFIFSVFASLLLMASLAVYIPEVKGDASPAAKGKSLTTFTTDDFSGSGLCTLCHSLLFDDSNTDVGMDKHWRSTMMANAAKDPYWQAKVSSEVDHFPELQGVIEDKCATCHMPMARTQAETDGSEVAVLGQGFLDEANELHEAAMDGVSCTLCHQIDQKNLGKSASFSGGYFIDTSTDSPNRPIYGPYDDQFIMNMRSFTGFTPQYGKQTLESELCATCHTLYTPYLDSEGNVAGEFPEQTPFLEWKESSYSRGKNRTQCQGCHMPLADGTVVISNMPGGGRGGPLKARANFAQHHFVGGNVFMLEILKKNLAALGISAADDHIDATIDRATKQLQENTAELSIADAKVTDDELTLQVKVENMAGHKFPTGFPSRRAWIEMRITDASGKRVFKSAKPKKTGKIKGNDADKNASTFEPHYDVITDPKQVQVYESIMGNTEGEVTYTLLRGASYLKDNRLLPRGFDPKKADDDVAVYGAADKDKNFTGGSDIVTYRIDISNATAPFKVIARLHYQSISYRFLSDLAKSDTVEVENFMEMVDKVKNLPVLVSEIKVNVE